MYTGFQEHILMQKEKIILRPYQTRIVKEVEGKNSLIVLPTGAGKTLIAILAIANSFERRASSSSLKAVFFVPTCLLVEQQANAIRDRLRHFKIAEFMGGKKLAEDFDILVSTPKAFLVAQTSHDSIVHWRNFVIIVFDEVHHVLKDHPYRKIAQRINSARLKDTQLQLQVVGLTASLTYSCTDSAVKNSIETIVRELQIVHMATAEVAELRASGYHGSIVAAELKEIPLDESVIRTDVIAVSFRKPHLMAQKFFTRLHSGESTAVTKAVVSCIKILEEKISSLDQTFKSPFNASTSLKLWGKYAHDKASKKSSNKINKKRRRSASDWTVAALQEEAATVVVTDQLSGMYLSLEQWYEAARLLVGSWEESEDAAKLFLDMMDVQLPPEKKLSLTSSSDTVYSGSCYWPDDVKEKVAPLWKSLPTVHPRFERLKLVLLEKDNEFSTADGSGSGFRGIVFVQQRVTAHVICHFIASDTELRSRFMPSPLYASSSPATSSLAISATQAKETIGAFAEGVINLLVSTVVAEEGMDIPAANVVIRFDPMVHSVSMVQGRGRARQADSHFVVMSERPDRTLRQLEEIEQLQSKLVHTYDSTKLSADQNKSLNNELLAAQLSRERSARDVLTKSSTATAIEAVSLLHLYGKKTKASVEDTYAREGAAMWRCTLSYSSVLRSVHVSAVADDKKQAKRLASVALLKDLAVAKVPTVV